MKRAVVTGGTRGIGLAVCRLLSARGYAVTALYSSDEAAAERARGELPAVSFVRADVSDEVSVARVFSAPCDLLVCNAGVAHFAQVQDIAERDLRRLFEVNAGGVVLCAKHAAKGMIARGGGAIVTVASVWGETGGSCESAYSATKGAVIAFTKALAKELAPSAVTVNCVSPGAVDTDMNARLTPEERKALEAEIPLGRMGTADEIAEAVLFLAEAHYITGQVLGVNGGLYI